MAKDVTDKLKSKLDTSGDKAGDKTPATPPVASHMKHYQSEQRSIVRQSCLKAAIQVVALQQSTGFSSLSDAVVNKDVLVKDAMRIAEEFEAWVHRD